MRSGCRRASPAGSSESSLPVLGGFPSDTDCTSAGFPAAVRHRFRRRGARPLRARWATCVIALFAFCALLPPATEAQVPVQAPTVPAKIHQIIYAHDRYSEYRPPGAPPNSVVWQVRFGLEPDATGGFLGNIAGNQASCSAGTLEMGWYRSNALKTRVGTNNTNLILSVPKVDMMVGDYYALAYCKSSGTYSSPVNLMGPGDSKVTVVEPIAKPARITATGGVWRVRLAWTAGAGGMRPSGWEYRHCTGGGISIAWISIPGGAGVRNYDVTGLTGGRRYCFVVRGVNGSGDTKVLGKPSDWSNATPVSASPPANLRATTPARQTLVLNWSAVTRADKYQVQYRLAGYTGVDWKDVPTTTQTTVTLSGLDGTAPNLHIQPRDGASYDVRVRALALGLNNTNLETPWTGGYFDTSWEGNESPNSGGHGREPTDPSNNPGGGGNGSGSSDSGNNSGGNSGGGNGGGQVQGEEAQQDPTLGRPAPAAAVNVNPGALRVQPADDPATDHDERIASYEVSLTRAPTDTVTVTPASSDTTIATVTGALTFTAENWATPQAVTITGVSHGRVGITHSISGGGYDDVQAPEVTAIVGDGGGDDRKTQSRALKRANNRDVQDESTDSPEVRHAPPGALAALARGHLAGLHAALTPRLNAGTNETSHITLAGHTLALDESLLSGLSGMGYDWDALPHPHGLSWFDATGQCTSWTTAACGEADNSAVTGVTTGLDNLSPHGQPAGPWDGLLYNLAAGLAGGGLTQSLWRNSGFVLTLGSDADTGPGRRWTLWGRNRVQAVSGLPAGSHYDSELRSGWLGLDTTVGHHARLGLALSRSGGQAPLRAVHPYLSWSDGVTTVSAMGGLGKSNETDRRWHRHTPDEPDSQANIPVTTLAQAPLGLRMGLVEVQRTLGVFGHLQLGLRADAAWASLSAGEGTVVQTETVRRLRAGLDASGSWQGIAGLTLTPSLQAHLRHDGGDGTTGRGLELAGGLDAGYGPARLTVQGRMLTARSEATTRERGLESTLSLGQPGSTGPSLSLSARWGDAAVGGDTLWQERLHHYHDEFHTLNNAWSLDARSEYGLVLPGGVGLSGFGSLSHDMFGPRILFGLQRGHPAPAR